MTFRRTVGIFCLIAGAVFLAINSVILFRGAGKWASESVEWYAFGIAAGLVPWVIAIMPALITDTWRSFSVFGLFSMRRPTAGTATVICVWIAFIGYNIVGGSGSIGMNRQNVMAARQHGSDVLAGIKARLAAKSQELAGVPQHRPAETIEREIDALRTDRAYKRSGECSNPRNSRERQNCQAILRLEGELAAATAGAKIQVEIADLNTQLASADPTASVAVTDPQAELIHEATGLDRAKITTWLPAATPVILEIGAATMWHFAFMIMGWGIGAASRSREELAEPSKPAALIPSPEAMRSAPVTSLEALTSQRKLCEWFFGHCTRPVASGAMSETEWFSHYEAVCKRSGDVPLPLESFRRIAYRYVPRIQQIEGVTYYHEVLPVIPQQAA